MTQQHPLPQAIKEVFAQLGIEAMLSTKIVYAVLDFGGFAQFPATRQILRDVIVEGYAQMLYDIYQNNHKKPSLISTVFGGGKQNTPWEPRVKQFILDFIKKTGYNDSLVDYTFQSILYGLGYLGNVAEPTIQQPKTVPFSVSSNAPKSAAPSQPIAVNTPPPFTPQVDTQFLVIKFKPDTATLYIDGIEQVATYGNWADELVVGQHNYRLEAPGYSTIDENVTIETSTKCVRNVVLQVSNSANHLDIQAETNDTEIWIDGVKKGCGQVNDCLSFGNHQFISRRVGFYDNVEDIDITANSKSIKLSKLSKMGGVLKVCVSPFGSKVMLNGKEVGETPLVLKDLSAGQYMVRVITEEGTSKDSIQEINVNQVTTWNDNIPSLFMTDYTQVKVGDFFYDDGTYTREKIAVNKRFIGCVVTLETSKAAKACGYKHGQILLKQRLSSQLAKEINPPCQFFQVISESEILRKVEEKTELQVSGFEISNNSIFTDNIMYPAIYATKEIPRYVFASNAYLPTVDDLISIINAQLIVTGTQKSTRGTCAQINIHKSDRANLFNGLNFTLSLLDTDTNHYWKFLSGFGNRYISLYVREVNAENAYAKYLISF